MSAALDLDLAISAAAGTPAETPILSPTTLDDLLEAAPTSVAHAEIAAAARAVRRATGCVDLDVFTDGTIYLIASPFPSDWDRPGSVAFGTFAIPTAEAAE